MNAIQNEPPELVPAEDLAPSPPLLRTLVACDLVESTKLTEQLGDRSIADFMHLLDRQTRDLLARHGGMEIDKTDGFLLMFERPVQAIGFALDYQRLLHDLSLAEFLPLKARVGIHVGDVVLWRNAANDVSRGAKAVEVEGLVKPVAARLMGLALPGQILMSGVARSLALRAQDELQMEFPPQWRMHGRYVFKGVAEPVPVFEVGELGVAPLRAPAYSNKAFREVPWYRRPATMFVEAAVLVAAIVIPAWIFLRSTPVIAFADRDWVVVGSLKNLTDEHRFDDSLDTAFRLGLEQSRYVNVLPDLKVRDTIGLMKRDAQKTTIDRSIGSEVALRTGARALILPTVAEVGRHVRVTAEVIDPNSQATVYTESADAVGADSVLASVDAINQRLRERLGEALASVSKDSRPLDKVATGNLEALRAYSLALDSYGKYKFEESQHLANEAIKLDPSFSLAHVHLARLLVTLDRREEAIREFRLALASADRMHSRDRLYIEAWLSSLADSPRVALPKWRTLAALYPDFFTGQSLFAYYSFNLANRADAETITAAERANSPQHPRPETNRHLLASIYLFNEHYQRASELFQAAEKDSSVNLFSAALPYAAQRQFDKVDTSLARGNMASVIAAELERYALRAAIAYDRGELDEAREILRQGYQRAHAQDPRYVQIFRGIELSLRALTQPAAQLGGKLVEYADGARHELAAAQAPPEKADARFQVLFAAYLAASLGDTERARGLISAAGPEAASGDWPTLRKLLTIAQAQLDCAEGRHGTAITALRAALDGDELYLAHVVLMNAYVAGSDNQAAHEQANWLATHRGRAYAEPGVRSLLNPLNVAYSNIARQRLDALATASAHPAATAGN